MIERYVSLLFVLLSIVCYGQEASSEVIEELYFDALTTAEGLPSQIIHNTYQDREGYMWISTEEAVVRYDGYKFTPFYEDPDHGINLRGATNFYEDRQDQLWAISGSSVLHRYDPDMGEFIHIPTPLEGGWATPGVHGIAEDVDNNLWIAGYGGLQYYNPQLDTIIVYPLEGVRSPQNWPHPEKVRLGQIYLDEGKAIWAATRKFGLVRFDLTTHEFKLYRFEPGFLGVHLDDWITDILPVQDGHLMIADHADGIVIWDLENEAVIQKINPARLLGLTSDAAIRDLHYESGNEVWISTEENGLILLDYKSNKILDHYKSGINDRKDSPGDKVTHVNRDKNGNFWIGSYALLRASNLQYQLEQFDHISDDPLSLRHDRIYWLSKDPEGKILVSTDDGISMFDPTTKKFDNSLTINDETTRSFGVYADDDYYWIGNYSFLNKIEKETYHIEASYRRDIVVDTSNNILRRACRIIKDGQEVIWMIDHWGRLKRIDERKNSITNVPELIQDPDSKKFINVIAILDDPDRQQIIAATDYGIATVSYDGTQVNKKNIRYKQTDLTQSVYSYLYRDSKNEVWVIIAGKVYKLDIAQWKLDCLPLNEPYGIGSFSWIVDDSQGVYWLSSFKGILRFNPLDSAASMLYTPNVRGYNFETASPVVVQDDKIYFSGSKGLSILDTRKITVNQAANPVVITSLEVNQSTYRYEEHASLQLGYGENDIDVSFSTMDFVDQEDVQYQYRLLPLDEDWVSNETNNSIKLYNLLPNNYKLEIIGANSDGVWHSSVTTLEINISPPWWQTLTAKIMAVLIGIGIVLLGQGYRYRLKMQRQNRVAELRNKISRDLHDDVGTILTGVAMQSELLEMSATDETKKVAHHIAEKSRQAMIQLRDTVWAMDSTKDSFEELTERIMDFVDDALEERGIHVEYRFEAERKKDIMAPNMRQALYLISKETITNISKHSNATEVRIGLVKSKREFILSIKDNGTQKEKVKSSGVGLTNMKRRATDLDGTFAFTYDGGYMTKVIIPDVLI